MKRERSVKRFIRGNAPNKLNLVGGTIGGKTSKFELNLTLNITIFNGQRWALGHLGLIKINLCQTELIFSLVVKY